MRKKKRKVYRVRLRLFINNLAAIETTLKAAQCQDALPPSRFSRRSLARLMCSRKTRQPDRDEGRMETKENPQSSAL